MPEKDSEALATPVPPGKLEIADEVLEDHVEEEIRKTMYLYLANGITTVRGMLGAPGQLALRDAAAASEIDSPTLYLAGPSFNGGSVSSPSQAADKVRACGHLGRRRCRQRPARQIR